MRPDINTLTAETIVAFIGSIFDRIVRVHHWSRNFAAQAG